MKNYTNLFTTGSTKGEILSINGNININSSSSDGNDGSGKLNSSNDGGKNNDNNDNSDGLLN